MARAILAGDMSVLAAAGLTAAEGWPHEDTADGLGMIVKTGETLSWLVVADGAVIGDCGLHGGPQGGPQGGPSGPVDEAGQVEIGYGLAAPSRGQGYGSEVVAAMTGWLLAQPEIRQVRACTLTNNMPSRRVLEKAGFSYTGIEDGEAVYERDAPASGADTTASLRSALT
jgi:RimJ/RimL family protein N-acetyltransferase